MDSNKLYLWCVLLWLAVLQMTAAQSRISYSSDNASKSESDSQSDEASDEISGEDITSTDDTATQTAERAQLKSLLAQKLRSSAGNNFATSSGQLKPPTFPTKKSWQRQQTSYTTILPATTAAPIAAVTPQFSQNAELRRPALIQPDAGARNALLRQSNPTALTTSQPNVEQQGQFNRVVAATEPSATVAAYKQQYEYNPYDITTSTQSTRKSASADYEDYESVEAAVDEDDNDYNPWRDNFYDNNGDGTYVYGYSLPNGVRRYERSYRIADGIIVEGFYTQLRQVGGYNKYELRCYRADRNGFHEAKITYLNRPPVVKRDVVPDVQCLHDFATGEHEHPTEHPEYATEYPDYDKI